MTQATHKPLRVAIQRLPGGQGLELPAYQTLGAAGMDVRAASDISIEPMQTVLVPTGFAIAVPEGFEAQMRPRSGLALKHGITLLNSPGTIDCDFRGEVGVIVTNLGRERFEIKRGDRIAQMIVARVERVQWEEVGALDETARQDGGFGSSGRE
jgi:dUTP pyrophosphatase